MANAKVNQYTDGVTDKLMHSGVQPWSAGDSFPFVVYKVEKYTDDGVLQAYRWAVSFAGEELTSRADHDEAERMALLFKQKGVRNRYDAQWVEFEDSIGQSVEEGPSLSDIMAERRQRADYAAMYGDAEHIPASMGDPDWQATRDRELAERDRAERDRAERIYAGRVALGIIPSE